MVRFFVCSGLQFDTTLIINPAGLAVQYTRTVHTHTHTISIDLQWNNKPMVRVNNLFFIKRDVRDCTVCCGNQAKPHGEAGAMKIFKCIWKIDLIDAAFMRLLRCRKHSFHSNPGWNITQTTQCRPRALARPGEQLYESERVNYTHRSTSDTCGDTR